MQEKQKSLKYIIQRLAEAIGEYKKPALITPLFIIGEALMEIIIPFLMADLIDSGINAGNLDYVWQTGLILIAAAFASLAFGIFAGKFSAVASAGFAKNLRHKIFYAIQKFSFANIDKFSTASLVTRLTTDVTNVQNAFLMIIRTAIRAPCIMILAVIMVLIINPQISLIYLAAVPILAIGMYLIITRSRPIFERVFKLYDKLNSVVRENLRGIRIVKAFVREEYETAKFKDVSASIYKEFSTVEKIMVFMSPLMQFCLYLCILLISWFGAQFIVSDMMTEGQLVSMISYSMQILMSLMMFSMILVMITMARASSRRIVEVLDEQTDITSPDNPVTEVRDGSIVFENVDFRYDAGAERKTLDSVSFSIMSGEMIGIIGSTGSAKSTLIQLIPRLYDAESGSIQVGGVDVRAYNLDTLRSAVSVVLQKNLLFSGTVRENLLWGNANATDAEIKHACEIAHADEFVSAFPDGYNTRIEQGGSNLSGGQKQRLCIARALLKKPKILILDDSTSAVDTKTDAQIRSALKNELKSTTKLIIAQRISSIEDADRILVMEGGRIDAIGTHDELLASNKIYREVYESQVLAGGA